MEHKSRIGGRSGEAALAALIEARGPFDPHSDVPETAIEPYEGRVPNFMIDLWRFHGAGALEAKSFWLPGPGALVDEVGALFEGDPDFGGNTHLLAYGAFGNLLCWNERHGPVLVGLQGGTVQAPGKFAPNSRLPDDEEVLKYLRDLPISFFDAYDSEGQPLLEAVRGRTRALFSGEIYGVYPITQGFEPVTPDTVRIMPIMDYLIETDAEVSFLLHDPATQTYNIRQVGEVRP